MEATQVTVRARRQARAEQLGELKKAQEESEARELRKAGAMAELAKMRLVDMEAPTGTIIPPKEQPDKTIDTVAISAVWLGSLTDDTILAATGHTRKVLAEIAGKYLDDTHFKMDLHNGYHIDPFAALAISLGNGAAACSEETLGHWMHLEKFQVHNAAAKFTRPIAMTLGQVLIPTTLTANLHINAPG